MINELGIDKSLQSEAEQANDASRRLSGRKIDARTNGWMTGIDTWVGRTDGRMG